MINKVSIDELESIALINTGNSRLDNLILRLAADLGASLLRVIELETVLAQLDSAVWIGSHEDILAATRAAGDVVKKGIE